MDSEQLERLWDPYRHEIARDFVSLSELIRRVRRVHPELDAADVRRTTLELLRYALARNEAEAGQFADRTNVLVAWDEAPEDVVQRVDAAWDQLGGREPNVGEIMWLRAPPTT